jgi:hypothetical protein
MQTTTNGERHGGVKPVHRFQESALTEIVMRQNDFSLDIVENVMRLLHPHATLNRSREEQRVSV